jgi:hypothetical protein
MKSIEVVEDLHRMMNHFLIESGGCKSVVLAKIQGLEPKRSSKTWFLFRQILPVASPMLSSNEMLDLHAHQCISFITNSCLPDYYSQFKTAFVRPLALTCPSTFWAASPFRVIKTQPRSVLIHIICLSLLPRRDNDWIGRSTWHSAWIVRAVHQSRLRTAMTVSKLRWLIQL